MAASLSKSHTQEGAPPPDYQRLVSVASSLSNGLHHIGHTMKAGPGSPLAATSSTNLNSGTSNANLLGLVSQVDDNGNVAGKSSGQLIVDDVHVIVDDRTLTGYPSIQDLSISKNASTPALQKTLKQSSENLSSANAVENYLKNMSRILGPFWWTRKQLKKSEMVTWSLSMRMLLNLCPRKKQRRSHFW